MDATFVVWWCGGIRGDWHVRSVMAALHSSVASKVVGRPGRIGIAQDKDTTTLVPFALGVFMDQLAEVRPNRAPRFQGHTHECTL